MRGLDPRIHQASKESRQGGWGCRSALTRLRERESGTARLEQAVAAFRAALEEGTRARVPLDWAMTQNNLGNALMRLGERESGTSHLEEAVAAFRAALEEWTVETYSYGHEGAQQNLARCLALLEQRHKQKEPARVGAEGTEND
jgi:tetratricopeptide (TPR) repeat protein